MKSWLTKIIPIFFAVSAFFGTFPLRGDVPLARGISLRTDVSGEDAQYLKSILRQLDRLAKIAKVNNRRSGNVTVVCGPVRRFGFSGDNSVLMLPGDSLRWREDFSMRRKVFGALASCRFGYAFPADSAGAAPWMVIGLEAEAEAAATSGQFFSANRGYPLLSEMVIHTGGLPDFSAACRMAGNGDPVIGRVIAEQSRLMLNLLAVHGRLGEVFAATCGSGAPDCFVKWYGGKAKVQDALSSEAWKQMWNRYHPMPAALALAKIAEMETCFVPELSAEGKPTGGLIRCPWRELAQRLKTPRPDAAVLKKRFGGQFLEIAGMLSAEENTCCRILNEAVMRFDSPKEADEAAKAFGETLEALKRLLGRRKAMSARFGRALDLSAPLPDRFGLLFQAVKPLNLSALDAEMTFLSGTLGRYLQD